MYRNRFKRLFDIVASAAALVILSPVLVATAIAIWLEDGRPVLFRQTRAGRGGVPFAMFKFRSMAVGTITVPSAALQTDAARITRVGKAIRRTNIDELPQLINILRGDMSIVGPRPALAAQSELTRMRLQNGALICAPGLTGLAQINAYTGMPESEKAAWDGRYISKVTLWRDLAIILRTFRYLSKHPPVY